VIPDDDDLAWLPLPTSPAAMREELSPSRYRIRTEARRKAAAASQRLSCWSSRGRAGCGPGVRGALGQKRAAVAARRRAVSIKDTTPVKGGDALWLAHHRRDAATEDAPVARRFRAAGIVLMGQDRRRQSSAGRR